MTQRVIVTRPAREAARWVGALRAAGFDAVALPLIAIESVSEPSALDAARRDAVDRDALMFVSAAAVAHFLVGDTAARLQAGAPSLRFWATGPGTAGALRDAGVPDAAIDAPGADAPHFDSEALWSIVRAQARPGAKVLIVRGGDAAGRASGRDWLANRIVESGASCDAVVAYRRLPPPWSDAERRMALEAAADGAIWLFSSSESIGHLRDAVPDADWRRARAIATHARIADAARSAGFGSVRVSLPPMPALVASIESFQ